MFRTVAALLLTLGITGSSTQAGEPATGPVAFAEVAGQLDALHAHWCTILVLVIFDGSLMHPWCCQAIALLA